MKNAEGIHDRHDWIKNNRNIIKNLFFLIPEKQKRRFLLIPVILIISAVFSQITPIFIGYLTDRVLDENDAVLKTALPVLVIILTVNILNETIKVARRLIVEDIATQTGKNARQRAAESLLKAPLSYFRSHMNGNIHGRLNRDLEGTVKLIKLIFMDFAPAVATGIAAIVTIFLQLPIPVAFIVILVIPAGTFIVLRQISTQKGIRVELMETKADMDGTMVELLSGIETIRTLDSAKTESDRILNRSEQLRKKEMRHHRSMAFYDCMKFINEAIFSVFVIGISLLLASEKIISVGTILTAYLCFTQLTGPLRELHRILDEFSESTVLAGDLFKILDLPVDFSYQNEEISDDSLIHNGCHECSEKPRSVLVNSKYDVRISGLNFSYPEKPSCKILSDIDLFIPSGSYTGIVGPSGCGKSTLIKVIDRLEQGEGNITLGGIGLPSFSRQALAKYVAVVPQMPFLIADTVYNNICYGLEREVTTEEVRDAARKANIADDIEKLPGKYDFILSEGGTNLSGGQRQRISLARIFLRKPGILILDEATSALDNTSEMLIRTEIERMNRELGITVISISHRLSTLQNCDEVIVMDHGRIVQKGKFHELERSPGVFHDMLCGILN